METRILFGCLLGFSLPVAVSSCSSPNLSDLQIRSLQAPFLQSFEPNRPHSLEASKAGDLFHHALQRATRAAEFAQDADSPATWSQVANLWQEAVDLMAALPESSPQYSVAQQKRTEYQAKLEEARKNADTGLPEQISQAGGGVGDTLAVFERRHGPAVGSGIGKGFRCDPGASACALMAMFIGDLAIQIELPLDHQVSLAQAIQIATPLLPSDVQQLDAWDENEEIHIIRYESPNLAQVFPTYNNPGALEVMVEHVPFQPDQAFRIIIAVEGDETF